MCAQLLEKAVMGMIHAMDGDKACHACVRKRHVAHYRLIASFHFPRVCVCVSSTATNEQSFMPLGVDFLQQ